MRQLGSRFFASPSVHGGACASPEEHSVELAPMPEWLVLEQIAQAAEQWGARWQPVGSGGRLQLPVQAGLRRGFLEGSLTLEPAIAGSRLRLEVVDRSLDLHTPAVAVLILSALGAAATVLWPFFPAIAPVLPLAIVLTLGGWFLVVSRLQNLGPEEFLASVAELAVAALEPAGAPGNASGE